MRHKDLGHIIAHMNLFYNRTNQVAKITPAEFNQIIDWHFGLPFFVVDFVDTMIGTTMVEENAEFYKERRLIEVISEDDVAFKKLKERIHISFLEFPIAMFNMLGNIDFDVLTEEHERNFDQWE